MEIENQKLLAIDGLHIWANSVLVQVSRIIAAREKLTYNSTALPLDHFDQASIIEAMKKRNIDRIAAIREFIAERHLFLISSYKLIQYIEWAQELDFIDNAIFDEILGLGIPIKKMRDTNEHAIKFFIGKGRNRDTDWIHEDENGIADASSTVDSKIGNILDWNDVAAAAARLIPALPYAYYAPPGS